MADFELRVVQMSTPKGSFRTMGVTPQILSRAVTDPMAAYIEQKVADTESGETWRAYLLRRIAEYLRRPEDGRPYGVSAWTVPAPLPAGMGAA